MVLDGLFVPVFAVFVGLMVIGAAKKGMPTWLAVGFVAVAVLAALTDLTDLSENVLVLWRAHRNAPKLVSTILFLQKPKLALYLGDIVAFLVALGYRVLGN